MALDSGRDLPEVPRGRRVARRRAEPGPARPQRDVA